MTIIELNNILNTISVRDKTKASILSGFLILSKNKGTTKQEFEEACNIIHSSISTRYLNRLEVEGLIEKYYFADETSRYNLSIRLTEKGFKVSKMLKTLF